MSENKNIKTTNESDKNKLINLTEQDFKELCHIIKRYVNLKKVLYYIDKSISEEFMKKQDAYFQLKKMESDKKKKECCLESDGHNHFHKENSEEFVGGCCGESILNNQSKNSKFILITSFFKFLLIMIK